jgi:hypothetical protein
MGKRYHGHEIKGLEDFKTIFEFDDESDTVAVISHPGWKSHHRLADELYEKIHDLFCEKVGEEIPTTGILRARQYTYYCIRHSPVDYLCGRAIALEEEFFRVLEEKNIPTLVTVPVKPESEADHDKIIERFSRNPDDIPEMDLSDTGLGLSPIMSSDYPNYLRDVSGERGNFYLVPTFPEDGYNEEENASGFIYGSPYYTCFETEFVSKFLDIVKGKTVLFAGSNMGGCAEATLGYLGYVDSDVVLCNNYCGLDSKIRGKIGNVGVAEDIFKSFPKTIRAHPKEGAIREGVDYKFRQILKNIERRNMEYGVGRHFNINNVRLFDGYLVKD